MNIESRRCSNEINQIDYIFSYLISQYTINSKLGNTDISAIGDGTLTGGLDALNSNLSANLSKKANVTIHRGWIEGTTVNIPISNGGLLVATRDDGSSLYVTCWVGISYLQKIAGDDLPLTVENNSIVGNIELYQSLTYYTF